MPHTEGTEIFEEVLHGCKVTTVHAPSEQVPEGQKKTAGSYITIATGADFSMLDKIEDVGECLAEVLDRLMRPYYHGKLFICGIGNRTVPADSLGPEVVCNLPLKVFSEVGAEGVFRDVVSLDPGTSFTNNIDTEKIAAGVVKAVGASCVLLVDAMITTEPSQLFQTIQLSTAEGFNPYFSKRNADWSVLGVPVISLGVPITIPLSAFSDNQGQKDILFTSTKIQDIISCAGRIIAYAILRMCWPAHSRAECFIFSGLSKDPMLPILVQERPPVSTH